MSKRTVVPALQPLGSEEKREANLAEAIRHRFLPFGGVDQPQPHPPVLIGNPPALDR
jgi:hypothetical protein